MARWEPDARGRLVEAAIDLYCERGFDKTTVAEIAARAGLTERTFFRHFTDKREVLFSGSDTLLALLVDKVTSAPAATAPIDAVVGALQQTAPIFEERRNFARKRHELVGAHAELRERELIKLSTWASAIGDALRGRGVSAQPASLAAEVGITIFKSAFESWLTDTKKSDLAHHIQHSCTELESVLAGMSQHAATPPKKTRRR